MIMEALLSNQSQNLCKTQVGNKAAMGGSENALRALGYRLGFVK